MQNLNPFEELEKAESMLAQCSVAEDHESNYRQLLSLLAQERVLDRARMPMYEQYKHGSEQAEDYTFREYMVRHKISEYALRLNKEVTDRLRDNHEVDNSVLVMCIKGREVYPEPATRTQ